MVNLGILCVGNMLMRDEGVGPRMAEELRAHCEFPDTVEVLDRGVLGMALLSDIRRFDALLVVDAVDGTGHPPGTVVRFGPSDIAPYEALHGAHDARLIDVLQAAALLGPIPETHCLGVQVLDRSPPAFSIGLTPPVEAAIPLLLAAVLDFIRGHGGME
ncbi:MAG: hydrogenase maturation protease [Coriobacteriales bacterium]|nr:hydrogenase maturation protease [Coriobacteriales bacterium]